MGLRPVPNPCAGCIGQSFVPLSPQALRRHLYTNDDLYLGVYPACPDGQVQFLTWQFEGQKLEELHLKRAKDLACILETLHFDYLFEVNHVLSSARIFLFFEEPVTMQAAREFGMRILARGSDFISQPDFISYDVMIPSGTAIRQRLSRMWSLCPWREKAASPDGRIWQTGAGSPWKPPGRRSAVCREFPRRPWPGFCWTRPMLWIFFHPAGLPAC